MKKKYPLLIIVASVLVIALLYFLLTRPKDQRYETIDTIMGVPVNSELIVHIPNLSKLLEKSEKEGVWKELQQWETIKNFKQLATEIRTTLSNQELSELLNDAQLTIATKISGRDGVEINYIYPLRRSNNKKNIEKLIKNLVKDHTPSSRNYSGFDIYKLADGEQNNYCYAFAKGLFILSTSEISLEDALLQISNGNSLLDEESFRQLKKTASDDDDFNVFINGLTFPKLLSLNLHDKYKRFVKELTDLSTQAGIDVSMKDDHILLNGFIYTNQDDFFYTNILLGQTPVQRSTESIIPSNTRFWATLSLSNETSYLDNYKRYLEQTGDIKAYNSYAEKFKKRSGQFPDSFIYPLLSQEIALVVSEAKILDETANRFCVLKTKSKSETEKALLKLLKNCSPVDSTSLQPTKYSLDSKLSYTIYPFPFPDFAHMMWGGLFFETQTNYCTLLDNYLIMGNSTESVKRYIDLFTRRKTLEFDTFYQAQNKYRTGNESTFAAYLKTQDGTFIKQFADNRRKAEIDDKVASLEKFPAMELQLKTIKDLIYINGFISYDNQPQKAPQTIWQSRLDNPLRMKPVMALNHKTKEQELVFQDNKNILYLVSTGGRILWKLPLDKPIMGTIHQVDCYKNGKLQYLFNTSDKLHLIDRNGNYVTNFPVTFRSPATNGIGVFDYDNNRNYRIFVSAKDKNTYLYSIEGKTIEGWQADKNEHEVKEPVQYFVTDGKDYITYNDDYRTYILSRRGEVRVLPKTNFTKAVNSQLSIIPKGKGQDCAIVATDTTGTIYITKLDGSVSTKSVGKFSAQHIFRCFDIDANGKNDYIFIDKKTLSVFKPNGKKLYDYTFATENINAPNFYSFSAKDKKLGICADNKIFLFNGDGTLYKGFPLEGYSDFTIGFTGRGDTDFNLFVSGNNDLLFNYAVK